MILRCCMQALARANAEFAAKAGPVRFHTQNVFMPSLHHKVWGGHASVCPPVGHCPLLSPCMCQELRMRAAFLVPAALLSVRSAQAHDRQTWEEGVEALRACK